jgi:hypothetical protein
MSFIRDMILIAVVAFVFAIYWGSILLTASSYKKNSLACTAYFPESMPKSFLVPVVPTGGWPGPAVFILFPRVARPRVAWAGVFLG